MICAGQFQDSSLARTLLAGRIWSHQDLLSTNKKQKGTIQTQTKALPQTFRDDATVFGTVLIQYHLNGTKYVYGNNNLIALCKKRTIIVSHYIIGIAFYKFLH